MSRVKTQSNPLWSVEVLAVGLQYTTRDASKLKYWCDLSWAREVLKHTSFYDPPLLAGGGTFTEFRCSRAGQLLL